MAIEKNSGLKAYEMDVLVSEEDIKISSAKLLPSLKLKGSYSIMDKSDLFIFPRDTFLSGIPPEDIELSVDNREMYGISLSIEQPVFTGSRLTHLFVKSKILSEEAHHSFERQKRLLTFEVKKAFYEALKEQLYIEILNKVIKSKKEGLRVIEERHKEGYIQREEVMIAETDLSASEFDLFKTKNRADYALSRLKKLIDYQGDDQLILAGEPINGSLSASLQEVKEFALKNREDLKMSVARTQVAQKDIEIAKSGFFPQVSLEGRYTAQKETNVTRPDVWMLTAQIDWPLFEWNRTKSEVRKREILMQRQRYEHDELTRDILLETENAWRLVKEKEKEIETKEKRLKTIEYKFKKAKDEYAEKIIKLADLLDIETELIRAYNDYIIAIIDLDMSLAHIEATLSSSLGKWFSSGEIYQLNLDSLLRPLKELITKKDEIVFENGSIKSVYAVHVDHSNCLKIASQDKSDEPQSHNNPNSSIPIIVQIAAVKTKERAEKFRTNLVRKISGKHIKIHRQNSFYKVRIAGFKNREEAERILSDLGIKNYLIIRTIQRDVKPI